MTVGFIIERIGHILVKNPKILSINDGILKKYDIDFRNCLEGDGVFVLAQYDLDEKINDIIEMGEFDEIKNNKSFALELLLKKIRNLNVKKVNTNFLVKESL